MSAHTILGLSGSLRTQSYNTAALDALARLAPAHVQVQVFRGLGDLPLFNPDIEENNLPTVHALKRAMSLADGLFIASPEYAHGISGVMKNALDWLVSGDAFISMPVALINTSPRASHAQAALREVVTTMSARLIEPASVSLPLLGSKMGVDDIVADPTMSATLVDALTRFEQELLKLP